VVSDQQRLLGDLDTTYTLLETCELDLKRALEETHKTRTRLNHVERIEVGGLKEAKQSLEAEVRFLRASLQESAEAEKALRSVLVLDQKSRARRMETMSSMFSTSTSL
jgi:uncharacterized protein (UPF0335 family)